MAYPVEDLARMAQELVTEAEVRAAHLRLLGGLAFFLTSPEAAARAGLRREYKDLDFIVDARGARYLPEVFAARGWEPDRRFNALHGRTRLLFYYQNTLQADVFIGEFEQCHKLDLDGRLTLDSPTLPLADLLLTKLQIHQMNAKDAQDIFTLLLDHDLSHGPSPGQVDLARILELTGKDWGWYTTVHDNLEALDGLAAEILDPAAAPAVQKKLRDLRAAIEAAPKSLRWQLRSQIGRRVPWYDEPEEVNR